MLQDQTIYECLNTCKAEGYYFCADLSFYVALKEELLPLFEAVDVLLTEELVYEIKNFKHPFQKQGIDNRIFAMVDQISLLGHLHIIPNTKKIVDLHMYCHQIGLDYKNPAHLLLAYYSRWEKVEEKKVLFGTLEHSLYVKAKESGLQAVLFR